MRFQLPSIRSAAVGMAGALVVASVLGAVVPGLARLLVLDPQAVIPGLFLWQIVTFGFVEQSPLGVIFGALIVWSIGGALEATWGSRRFVRFALGILAAAGVATVLLNLVAPRVVGIYGGQVLTTSLWVAYGLINRGRQLNFWGMPVSGAMFALIGAAFVFLNAAFNGISMVIPELFGLGFVYLVVSGYTPSSLWLRLRSWQLERDLKRRSTRLRSIEGGQRNVGGGSDRYIH